VTFGSRLQYVCISRLPALVVVAIVSAAMTPPPPCRARLRLHAQTVSQARSMLLEPSAQPLAGKKIHQFLPLKFI